MKKGILFFSAIVIAAVISAFSTGAASPVRLTDGERELLAEVLTAECGGEPIAARIAIAGILLDSDDCLADAVRVLSLSGAFTHTGRDIDRLGKDYRISLDAVDAAQAGCRPLGKVRSFVREERRLDLSLDFTDDGDQSDGTRIGNYVFR